MTGDTEESRSHTRYRPTRLHPGKQLQEHPRLPDLRHLPTQALDTAKDSIGGAQAVAQHVAQSPQGGTQQAHLLVAAANHAFTHAVAHTSLIAGVILAAGTVVVALILPGRTGHHGRHAETGATVADGATQPAVKATEHATATAAQDAPAGEVAAVGRPSGEARNRRR
jgi:hypothetical protein